MLIAGYINDAGNEPLHHMVVVPHNPNQSAEEREVLMGNMQNMEQHNLLQRNLMVERWERWIALNGDDIMLWINLTTTTLFSDRT
jgi:hypothetical protein